MEKSLKEFRPGDKGKVVRVKGEGSIKRRIYDMGITPGTEILLYKTAPLGDPIEVKLRGYDLSMRKSEAENVIMEFVGNGR